MEKETQKIYDQVCYDVMTYIQIQAKNNEIVLTGIDWTNLAHRFCVHMAVGFAASYGTQSIMIGSSLDDFWKIRKYYKKTNIVFKRAKKTPGMDCQEILDKLFPIVLSYAPGDFRYGDIWLEYCRKDAEND